jgi:TolB-like protein/class 3 adenylate cyclase/Tfp pilus assembly protein PilF
VAERKARKEKAEMPPEPDTEVQLEIGHVLFIDIVGYSKALIDDQRALQQDLNDVVRNTEQFRAAESAGKLIRLPTGDGMALVFFTSPEAPLQCAMQIADALKSHPRLRLRMGINTGPVSGVADVNDRSNVAGAGINIAQRVMDLGDGGHILLSKRAAEDLSQYRRWEPYLHDIGEVEVKHGVRVGIVNFYTDSIGNPELSSKLRAAQKKWTGGRIALLVAAGVMVAVIAALVAIRQWQRPSALSGMPEKSIAVLPFENLSANQENAFFTDGVQGEILTDLAKVADLKVISQTSVMQYRNTQKRNLRDIAQALRVSHILEGSVQRAANRVRVNAQLIDARNDTHMWAETFDRELADVFAIQSEIAQTIANQLRAKLSPREEAIMHEKPTSDMAAYDLYLRAREIWRNTSTSSGSGGAEKFPEAIRLLDDAVRRDPNFVPALCALVRVHMYLHWLVPDPVAGHVELARNALDAATRLQPDSGDVHLTRAFFYYQSSRDYAAALQELALAKPNLPNSAEVPYFAGIIERRQNKWDASTRHLEEALQLDPRNVQYISELTGSNYLAMRRYADAIRVLDETLAWKGNDFGLGLTRALIYFFWKADLGPWKQLVAGEFTKNADPNDLITARLNLALLERDYHTAEQILVSPGGNEFDDDGFFTPREFNEAIVARALGDTAKANMAFQAARERAAAAVRQRPDDSKALIALAQSDAELGRKEDAIREAERATQLLPVEKDVMNGTQLLIKLTGIYAQTGEIDRALNLLEQMARNPSGPSYISYGSLKLDRVWDPLRGNPRFDKIVAALVPRS